MSFLILDRQQKILPAFWCIMYCSAELYVISSTVNIHWNHWLKTDCLFQKYTYKCFSFGRFLFQSLFWFFNRSLLSPTQFSFPSSWSDFLSVIFLSLGCLSFSFSGSGLGNSVSSVTVFLLPKYIITHCQMFRNC